MTKHELCAVAMTARDTAYAPYSACRVGAALLASDGTVYTGCNVENASCGATICAERTALVKAVSDGARRFTMLAVAGSCTDHIDGGFPPCGVCRQMLSEFCTADTVVLVVTGEDTFDEYRFGELFPAAFDSNNLKS